MLGESANPLSDQTTREKKPLQGLFLGVVSG